MNRPSRILIVSASAGTGHLHAAEAVRAALLERRPDAVVRHADILELAPAWLRLAYGSGCELLAARAPGVWKELYVLTDGHTDLARWGPLAHRTLFRSFARLLTREPWDLVVSTHFLPCQLTAGRPGFPPFTMVVTDFALHRFWAQPRVRRYFVATEDLAREVQARLPLASAEATGIPVSPRFHAASGSDALAAARASLGLPQDAPVALVMGGGLGIGIAESVRATLGARVPGLHVVAVAGSNDRAREELASLAAAAPGLRVYGRVENVPELMAAADVVVTKPGGLTSSEALAVGRPLVLFRGIPGQEEGNTRELTRLGAALHAADGAQLRDAVERIFMEPELLLRTRAAARRIGRPGSAAAVARGIERTLTARLVA